MTTKLNGHTLSNNTVEQMKIVLKNSVNAKREMGFALCSDENNNLNTGEICIGEHSTICINKGCKKGKDEGDYHTHPGGDSVATANDLSACGAHRYICVGGNTDDKLRCYAWQHNIITQKEEATLLENGRTDDSTHKKHFECLKDYRWDKIREQMGVKTPPEEMSKINSKYYKEILIK